MKSKLEKKDLEKFSLMLKKRKSSRVILWNNTVHYKGDTEWLKKVELELENVNIQEIVQTTE